MIEFREKAIALRRIKESFRAFVERSFPKHKSTAGGTWSSRRINRLKGHLPCESTYLEIGIFRGDTFLEVDIPNRVGVDPFPRVPRRFLPKGSVVLSLGSDAFFKKLDPSEKFDVIFLDGLHTGAQTFRDFHNSLLHSYPRSVILIDDVLPDDDVSAIPGEQEWMRYCAENKIVGFRWHGSSWQALIAISIVYPELEIQLVRGGETNHSPIQSDNAQAIVWNLDDSFATVDRLQQGLGIISSFEGRLFSDLREEFPLLFEALDESLFFRSWETRWTLS